MAEPETPLEAAPKRKSKLPLLIGLVLTGLSMTVALRQVSARFMWADFSASGGDGGGAPE